MAARLKIVVSHEQVYAAVASLGLAGISAEEADLHEIINTLFEANCKGGGVRVESTKSGNGSVTIELGGVEAKDVIEATKCLGKLFGVK